MSKSTFFGLVSMLMYVLSYTPLKRISTISIFIGAIPGAIPFLLGYVAATDEFGLAAGTYFKNLKKTKQTAIIAKDTRLSGYTLEPALVSGLASAGMHVYTLGPLPTNGLAMLTKSM